VKHFASWFGLCLLACLIACFAPGPLAAQDQSSAPPAAQKPAAAANPKAAARAGTDPALLHPDTLKAKAPDVYEATFATTKGDFVVQVTRSWAPNEADRFYNLVKHGYFNNVEFFRVVPGFVVQFGLTGSPAVNKAWENANIKDDPVTQTNAEGTITFAQTGSPNSRSTQVFINLTDNARLDHSGQGFAPFGQITSGMDVVKNLYGGYADATTDHQEEITNQGNAYLEKNFPKLDSIKTAKITSPVPAPTATHKAAPPSPNQ
jgi:peptidyl-prolyl cis-trans isomerase A (cyclophilin A)